MSLKIVNLGLPDKRDKRRQGHPCIIASVWDKIVQHKGSDLTDRTKVSTCQRPCICDKCLAAERGEA